MRCFAALVILFVSIPGAVAEEADSRQPSLVLPRTFEKTWYRAGKRSAFSIGRKHTASGDLTITPNGLDLVARQKKIHIPLARIHVISFGKMTGDVDTDWAVLAVGGSAPWEILGFRDGRRLGYGQATREIYDTIVGAALQARAAQYRAPVGYQTFDLFAAQCTLAVPEGWNVDLRAMVLARRSAWGTAVLSPDARRAGSAREGAVGRLLTGAAPSIFLGLHEAAKGMRCSGLSGAAKELVLRFAGDRLREDGLEGIEAFSVTPASVSGCEGLRITAKARKAGGFERMFEAYAVAEGETLFLLGAYLPDGEAQAAWRGALDTAVSTLTFPVAR